MKIRETYYKVRVDMGEEEATMKVYDSGRADQIIRACVHEGFRVTIDEVKEIKEITSEEYKYREVMGIHTCVIEWDTPKPSELKMHGPISPEGQNAGCYDPVRRG